MKLRRILPCKSKITFAQYKYYFLSLDFFNVKSMAQNFFFFIFFFFLPFINFVPWRTPSISSPQRPNHFHLHLSWRVNRCYLSSHRLPTHLRCPSSYESKEALSQISFPNIRLWLKQIWVDSPVPTINLAHLLHFWLRWMQRHRAVGKSFSIFMMRFVVVCDFLHCSWWNLRGSR